MIFTSTAEVNKVVSIHTDTYFASIEPYLKRASKKYLKPILGKALYEQLDAYVNSSGSGSASDSNTELLDELLELSRCVVANIGIFLYIPIGNVVMNSVGISISVGEKTKPAFQWQVEKLQQDLLNTGLNCIDDLYEFLESNKSSFDTWNGSDEDLEYNSCFIKTAKEFSKYYNIRNSRGTYESLKAIMMKVQDITIRQALCPDYYNHLIELITDPSASGSGSASSITISEADQLVIDSLKPAIAHYTIAEATKLLPLLYLDNGIRVQIIEEEYKKQEPASLDRLHLARETNQKDGATYLSRAIQIMVDDIESYPDFKNSSCYVDPEETDSSETAGNKLIFNTKGITGLL